MGIANGGLDAMGREIHVSKGNGGGGRPINEFRERMSSSVRLSQFPATKQI